MSAEREPIPPGAVSTIRGRWQRPALELVSKAVLAVSVVAVLVPGAVGRAIGVAVVAAIVAAPLLRVAWLVFRWTQERDRRFVITGLALLGVVGTGAVLAALGIGS
ncbi:MAG: hypothetical protein S0880_02140 [Actinomycetota bacterium]|nr:hypothetical protein [Actinomycetota bacterium]